MPICIYGPVTLHAALTQLHCNECCCGMHVLNFACTIFGLWAQEECTDVMNILMHTTQNKAAEMWTENKVRVRREDVFLDDECEP